MLETHCKLEYQNIHHAIQKTNNRVRHTGTDTATQIGDPVWITAEP